MIIKQQRLWRRRTRVSVSRKQLASGTPITDGIIKGDIQIGAMGTGPFPRLGARDQLEGDRAAR